MSKPPKVEFYRSGRWRADKWCKEWYWCIRASNGNILADSGESYKRKIDCIKGFRLAMSAVEK